MSEQIGQPSGGASPKAFVPTILLCLFPGGLGVREALIAALAPLIGLPFDAGILLGSVDRIIWLTFLAAAASLLAIVNRRRPAGSAGSAGSAIR